MQHGYFDDFRAVRDQHGKIFSSPERLIDAQVAQPFPPTQVTVCPTICLSDASCRSVVPEAQGHVLMQMVRPDGIENTIPPPPGQFKTALLCTAFRAGAEVTISCALHRTCVACCTSQQCTSGSFYIQHEYVHRMPCNLNGGMVSLSLTRIML